MLEKNNPEMPLKTQADLLGISYSSLFYTPVPRSARELAIKRRIDEIYTAWPFYGSRRITAVLNREMTINRKKVQRCMREMGIAGICRTESQSTPCRPPDLPVFTAKSHGPLPQSRLGH